MNRTRFECQILIIGAGPAGIAAACEAAGSSFKVILVDRGFTAGGQIWRGGLDLCTSESGISWLTRLEKSGVRLILNAEAVCSPRHNTWVFEKGGDQIFIAYKKLILATGARERFLPFPGWTLPGVFGAGGLQALVKGGLDVENKKILIAGTGPLLFQVASTLKKRGAKILGIAEQTGPRKMGKFVFNLLKHPKKLRQGIQLKAGLMDIPFKTGVYPHSARGKEKLEYVKLRFKNYTLELECDYLACGFHLLPNTEIPLSLRCETDKGNVTIDKRCLTSRKEIYCAGEVTGIGGLEVSLLEGRIAGLHAVGERDRAEKLLPFLKKEQNFANVLNQTFELNPRLKSLPERDTIVCRCEDVSHGELKDRVNWRDAKLQTRCGMGPCQGRICGGTTSFLYNWETGGTRPPVSPTTMKSLRL